jgi:hypothetical protein
MSVGALIAAGDEKRPHRVSCVVRNQHEKLLADVEQLMGLAAR